MRSRPALVLGTLAVLTLASAVLAVGVGSVPIPQRVVVSPAIVST